MSFYDVLGVNKNASTDLIKKQYKKLALKHHPDRGGDPEMFKKISEAYQTLSDSNKRREYDNPNPFSQNGGIRRSHFYHNQEFVDPNIIFQNFFNNNAGFHQAAATSGSATFNIRIPTSRNNSNTNVFHKTTSTEIRGNLKTETTTEIKNGVRIQTVKQTDIKNGKVVTSVNQKIGF